MVNFAPSNFYPSNLQPSTIIMSEEQFKKIEEQEKSVGFQRNIKETVRMRTMPVETVFKQSELHAQGEIGKRFLQFPEETKYLILGAPVAVSLVSPQVGVPMLIGELGSIGVTGAFDVIEDVIKKRPIKIDYPPETYIASGVGGMVAGGIGAYISPFAVSSLAKFSAGGLIATSGLFAKDVIEEPLARKPIQLESPTTYGVAFLLGGATYWGASKAMEKIQKLSEEGKITWIKPGVVSEEKETWLGLYKERGPEAEPLFGIKVRSLGGSEYEISAGKSLTFTSYSPLTKGGEINLPKSPVETYLKLPAMKEFYQKMSEGGLTPEQLEVTKQFINKSYTQPTPAPISSLREIISNLERAEGFQDDIYNVLKDFLNKNDIMVYGSVSQKMYGALDREIHDLDIKALKPRVAENLISKLQNELGDKIIIKTKVSGDGYEILNKGGEKILEIFKYGIGYSPYSSGYLGYGYYQMTPVKTEEGLFMRLQEQGARKMISSFTPQETRLFPLEHRIKDIGDLVSFMKYYASKNPELNSLFEEFLKTGNKEIMQKALSQIPEKAIFAFSFSSQPLQSLVPLYTSIFAGFSLSSSSVSLAYSLPPSEPSKLELSEPSKSSKSSEKSSQVPSVTPSFTPSHPTPSYPSLPSPPFPSSPPPSASIISPPSPSTPIYPSDYPSSLPLLSYSPSYPNVPVPNPSLPLIIPRDIDLNKKAQNLMYESIWRSELKYV